MMSLLEKVLLTLSVPCILVGISMTCGCGSGSSDYQSQVQITTAGLPTAIDGETYTAAIEASGGDTPYTWNVTGLPSGLSWSQVGDSVQISGTPDTGTSSSSPYPVTAEVTDSSGQSDGNVFSLVVDTPLKADFSADSTYGTASLTVDFSDTSTGGGGATSWSWDFGDGVGTSTEKNPSYVYDTPGWYTVTLTVSDAGGVNDTCRKKAFILVANNVIHVDAAAAGANDGTSWTDAYVLISDGLNAASDYDLVLVADGTYTGASNKNLVFGGKKVYLKGVDHNNPGAAPVIDCESAGRAFNFSSGETEDCTVDNFTVRNGNVSSGLGGTIYCSASSPTIRNCTFSRGDAPHGGALYCTSSSPTLTNCIFSDNRADGSGGAISLENSSNPTLTNCTFGGSSAVYGGAIFCYSSNPTITNCTFSGNSPGRGGAIYCSLSRPTLNNCILWGNSATVSGDEIYISNDRSSCTLNHCCVDNNGYGFGSGAPTTTIDDSNNCLFVDPRFVGGGDLRLQNTSPCIDAGDDGYVPAGVTTDLDGNPRISGSEVDMGAYEHQS